jgi:hypothetical protein
MKTRCSNINRKAYHNYGDRGIKVCERWQNSFALFYKNMGQKPDNLILERENNNGNYEQGNCRRATRKEQSNNQKPISCGLHKQRWFCAINILLCRKIKSNSVNKFARQNGLDTSGIVHCLRGNYKSSKGWTFQWI